MRKCLVTLAVLFSCINTSFALEGLGTEASPWLIQSLADFDEFASNPNYWTDHARLDTDIDLTGRTYTTAPIAPDTDIDSTWTGISFTGTFDGNGHTIFNLSIHGSRYIGLFGQLAGGSVANLTMENVDISASWIRAGSICGESLSSSIKNCHSSGTVSADHNAGGICGYNSDGGIIISCYSSCTVTGSWEVGGLCGLNSFTGTIISSYSNGTVSGNRHVGGLCGQNRASITSCYATGTVNASINDVGGLCGYNDGDGCITSCYSTGIVNSTCDDYGGLCGYNYGSIISCYFLSTAGPDNGIGESLTDSQMQQQSSFVGWDFISEIANGTNDFWVLKPGQYPSLYCFDSAFTPYSFNGSGAKETPYHIATIYDLGAIWQYTEANYILDNSIDMAGITFSTAIIPRLAGNFNGNGYAISNLTFDQGSYLGLFGRIYNGSVKNLALENIDISTSGISIGGLCAQNIFGRITNCYSTGNIIGTYGVGGLCSLNSGFITCCYFTGTVAGNEYVGGLCSHNRMGSILNCYSTGTVEGIYFIGGLCAENDSNYDGTITSCYSTSTTMGIDYGGQLCASGSSNSIINCYYLDISGQHWNNLGTPLTDAQMKQQSSFISWDFLGETTNGTSDFWIINPGQYPLPCYFDAGFTPYSFSGSGTDAAPYHIATPLDLGAIWQYPDASYTLDNDIDLIGVTFNTAVVPWFAGAINGNGHEISHLTIENAGCYLGLIGKIYNGSVTNLAMEDAYIDCSSWHVGSICGWNLYGNIARCHSTNSIYGSSYVGGLCGRNDGNISGCYSNDIVNGNSYIGGLCGINSVGSIANCHSTSTVGGDSNIGGLCGCNGNGSITDCYSTGMVAGFTSSTGGLCGDNSYGSITSCHSASTVDGTSDNTGGFCGYNDHGSIADCYSTGEVNGIYKVGGFCGDSWGGNITSCYSTGNVNAYGENTGGFCGDNYLGDITICYFLETAGLDNDLGAPLTDSQMQQQSSFIGWDFENIWHMPYETIGYPMLFWQRDIPGDFTAGYGVTLVDFAIFSAAWLTSSGQPGYNEDCNLVDDGTINIADLAVFTENWLRGI